MAISSVNFNQNNTILDRHKIISTSLRTDNSCHEFGPFDFVDLNDSGRVEKDDRMNLDNVQVVHRETFYLQDRSNVLQL